MAYETEHCKPRLEKPDSGKGHWIRTKTSDKFRNSTLWDKVGPDKLKKGEKKW